MRGLNRANYSIREMEYLHDKGIELAKKMPLKDVAKELAKDLHRSEIAVRQMLPKVGVSKSVVNSRRKKIQSRKLITRYADNGKTYEIYEVQY
jgi:hypothetical protein